MVSTPVRARIASHTSRCLFRRLRGSLPNPVNRKKVMPNTGMKMMARIQAIAVAGLRLAEIKTAAINTIKTCAASSNQLIKTPCNISP